MAAKPSKITVSPDSEPAKRIKAAEEYIDVEPGDAVYRLQVNQVQHTNPTPEQVARSIEGIRKAAGGREGLVDEDAFKVYIAKRRRSGSRPSVRL